MLNKKPFHFISAILITLCCICMTGCSEDNLDSFVEELEDTVTMSDGSFRISSSGTSEDALPIVTTLSYLPTISETSTSQSEYIWIDSSNSDQGYVAVQYLGVHTGEIKFQITGPNQITYTFSLEPEQDIQIFPLTSGSGTYTLNTFEQSEGSSYYTVDSTSITVTLESEFITYLYPNQFVNYTQDSLAIDLAIEAATDVYSEIDLVASVYTIVMDKLEYDDDLASLISSGGLTNYIPDLDSVISNEQGICFDYAALMVSMLRIQGVPAKLVIGYAGESYHAWINVYTEEYGWIDEVIYFDGVEWTLMDPTFADNNENNSAINDFIGDGTNYTEKYVY